MPLRFFVTETLQSPKQKKCFTKHVTRYKQSSGKTCSHAHALSLDQHCLLVENISDTINLSESDKGIKVGLGFGTFQIGLDIVKK